MSKGKAKVEIEDDKANKGFENAPKLFNKWGYDDIKVPLSLPRSKIPASLTTSQSSPPSPRSSSPTPPDDTKPKDSEKHSAPSSKDWLAPCNSPEGTLVRRSRPSESSGTPSKSSTSSPARTPSRSWWEPSSNPDPEKIPPVSEPVVWSESRQLTYPPLEESTWPSTSSPTVPETDQWRPRRPSQNAWPMKSSTPKKATPRVPTPWRRRKKSRKSPKLIVDAVHLTYLLFIHPITTHLYIIDHSIQCSDDIIRKLYYLYSEKNVNGPETNFSTRWCHQLYLGQSSRKRLLPPNLPSASENSCQV